MNKPRFLYHISNRISDDETILKTHRNVDITQGNENDYVFASQKPNYISCFRGDFSSFQGCTKIEGTSVMLVVTKDIENVRKVLREKPSIICTVSSEPFTQSRDKTGRPTDEWSSTTDVPILEKGNIPYEEILGNAQVFYMQTDKEFKTKQYEELVGELKQRYSNVKEALRDLVNSGELVYENKIAQINEKWLEEDIEIGEATKDNHELIEKTLKEICNKLNKSDVDYYLAGALAALIGSGVPLFRYHGDIDFMINEKDIEKVRKALEGTEYDFVDHRLDNEKTYTEELGYTQGEHEVIAYHRDSEFHLGFFLFERQPDNSLVTRGYFMQEQEGKRIAMVLEKRIPQELVSLEYSKDRVEFAGTEFRIATPESVYARKAYTRNPKDLLDIQALEGKVDIDKIAEMKTYKATSKIVPATLRDIYR